MAISGIGSQTITQFPQRAVNSAEKDLNKTADTTQAVKTTSDKPSETNSTRFKAVVATNETDSSRTSRRNLSEDELNRQRFQIQSESRTSQGQSGKALQSFIDVADFERKDELNNSTGFDVFA